MKRKALALEFVRAKASRAGRLAACAALAFVVALSLAVGGGRAQKRIPRTHPADPCCAITAIDAARGLVTARDASSGQTFQFEVDSRRLLAGLKVGQKVYADFATKKVSIYQGDPCCQIISLSDTGAGGLPAPDYGTPCCDVIALDAAQGLATVRDTTTARTMQFRADATDLRTLKVGDRLAADMAGGKVFSVGAARRGYNLFEPDTATPCCNVVNVQPDPAVPCCEVVTAQNTSTGLTFQFTAGEALKNSLKVGQSVSLDPAGGYAFVQSAASGATGRAARSATYSYPVRPAGGATPESAPLSDKPWEVTPNPSLRGSTGRLVVNVPGDARLLLNIMKAGETNFIDSWYGSKAGNFLPGSYDIKIWDARLRGVPVERGHDTRLRVGALSVPAGAATFEVYDETRTDRVYSGHAAESSRIVLPVGRYFVRAAGGEQLVVIRDGRVTEF
jgi:Cu/Ag efflux protein CusF